MRRKFMGIIGCMMAAAMALTGCGSGAHKSGEGALSLSEATTELTSLLKNVKVTKTTRPTLDIYSDTVSEAEMLDDIDTFPIMVKGTGDINIEVAAATELSADSPDDWLCEMAKKFNAEKKEIGGRTVSVSIRKITSGEVVTYMRAGAYEPEVFIPSNDAWGKMLDASGFDVNTVTERLVGNTAGILIKDGVYKDFVGKYGDVTVANVLEASLAGDLTFAYTNPYTSSTGLNVLTAMLAAFDPDDPLSDDASSKLLEYQASSPPVAYTTAVLRNQAAKGIINAMVMEEQAYVNTPEISGYEYVPVGIRHDHPVYTFGYDTAEEVSAAELFTEYCMTDEAQKLATKKGFNRHEDYVGQESGLDGAGYLSAQTIWKKNSSGGRATIAVFVADVSGSMDGEPLNSLKKSLINCSSYISSDNYVGLVSYSSDVNINLPIAQFDDTQRAYFSGEVKNLSARGGTATYDAVLVAANMLLEKQKEISDARLMLFVLSDGAQNEGYELSRITSVMDGLDIPTYTIAYNYGDSSDELSKLSSINEAAALSAGSDDISNKLRNLFNVTV